MSPARLGDPQAPVGHARSPLPPVHQALFGYDAGHRLLRTSTALDPPTESLLTRLTDGTGATDVPGFDGHLAGYPLPGRRYALTRTWTAPEVPRPGAVWSHVLLLEHRNLGAGFDPARLAGLLGRPGGDRGYQEPLAVSAGPPQKGPARPLPAEPDGWRPALTALLEPGTAWLTARAAADTEPAVLALWQWMSPTLRRAFAFSLGATGARRAQGRPFDLLVVPAARRLTARADLGPPPATTSTAADLIADDLAGRLPPSFGDFCRFCGAETSSRSAVGDLALAWREAATAAPGEDAAAALTGLATAAAARYPSPSSMRRYKRTLVHPDYRLPAGWTPDDALRVLATTRLGLAVSADDVDVAALVGAAQDPSVLAAAASASPPGGFATVVTAAEALPAAASRAVEARARPDWLPVLAARAPAAAALVLAGPPPADRAAWARAFWSLAAARRQAVADPALAPGLAWLAARAPRPDDGQRLLVTYCAAVPGAVAVFAVELAKLDRARAVPWQRALTGRPVVDAALAAAPGLPAAAATALLASLLPSDPAVRAAGLRPWRALALQTPPVAAAVNALLLDPERRPNKNEILLAARSFAVVWLALAGGDEPAWTALGDYPSDLGPQAAWDRGRRVAHRFARTVTVWDGDRPTPDAARQAVAAARRDCASAADQLAEELAKAAAPKRTTGKKHKKKGVIEQVVTAIWPAWH